MVGRGREDRFTVDLIFHSDEQLVLVGAADQAYS